MKLIGEIAIVELDGRDQLAQVVDELDGDGMGNEHERSPQVLDGESTTRATWYPGTRPSPEEGRSLARSTQSAHEP